jgi:hypothetical protein
MPIRVSDVDMNGLRPTRTANLEDLADAIHEPVLFVQKVSSSVGVARLNFSWPK